MKTTRNILFVAMGLLSLLAAPSAHAISANMFPNGSFTNGLEGWKCTYKLEGESWYADNENFVKVIPIESGRPFVLQMTADKKKAWAPGQGVKVDSNPIPFDPAGKYRLTMSARTMAPNCRILLEGFSWKPGIKPHDNPKHEELRKCYRFAQIYFNGAKGGDFGNVNKHWDTATMSLPDPGMTDLAKGMYEKIKFVCLHIVAVGSTSESKGWESRTDCHLFIDDVKLERIK